jgi:hypothetical protein
MLSLRSIAIAATAAAALVPAAASAKTYCVFKPDCDGTAEWSIQDAVTAANADSEAARIELGPGTFTGNLVVPKHAAGLEIVGEGPQNTILEPSIDGEWTLELHGDSLSHVGMTVPDLGGTGARGLDLVDGASADDIRIVVTGNVLASAAEIELGGHLSHAYIDAGARIAVGVGGDKGPGDVTITDSYIRGSSAISVHNAGHSLVARRDRFVLGDDDQNAVIAFGGSTILEDSLIDLRSHTNARALTTYANGQAAAAIEGRHLTVLADSPGATGLGANVGYYKAPSTASLSDSVLAGVALRADGDATMALTRVDTWPAAPDDVTGAGALTTDGSFSADPLLGADFVPGPSSPLIDAAAPLGTGDSDTDLAGTARTLDGDGNCDARPDLGAFEAPAAACPPPTPAPPAPTVDPQPPAHDVVAPVVSKVRLVRRRAVRFTVSEAARVTVRLARAHHKTIVIRRAVGAGRITLKLKRTLRHGRYAIRVIAVDGAGNRSAPAVARRRI